MGMVFMAFTVFGVLRRKTGHALAVRDYPALAVRLKLAHRPSTYQSGVGSLAGALHGLRILVDPDDQRWIAIRFGDGPRPRIEVHTYEHNRRVAAGMRAFRVSERRLVGWFRTSQAAEAEIDVLEGSGALLGPLRSIRQLKTLSMTSNGLTAVFDYGSPPFIPVAIVEEVVPVLIELALALQAASADPGDDGEPSDENANDFND